MKWRFGFENLWLSRDSSVHNNNNDNNNTVCAVGVGKRHQKWSEKENKYAECRAGLLNLYEGYAVKQVNIVFDFIGGYSKNLFKNPSKAIPKDTMKIKKLIDNIICKGQCFFGNYIIVRRFKAF